MSIKDKLLNKMLVKALDGIADSTGKSRNETIDMLIDSFRASKAKAPAGVSTESIVGLLESMKK